MLFEISNVAKAYKKKTVLKDISLTVHPGECVGILGENGSGKSTLLSILAGVNQCDSGSFKIDGEDAFANRQLREKTVGYVPQNTPLISELSAWDNLRMWYDASSLTKSLEEGFLGMLGIGSFIKTPVKEMSGGMKKRLSIGCAIHAKPALLLLDEPTASLDIVCKERIYTYFQNYKKNGGALILSTHEVQEIELCDRLYIIKNGVLEEYSYDGNMSKLAGRL